MAHLILRTYRTRAKTGSIVVVDRDIREAVRDIPMPPELMDPGDIGIPDDVAFARDDDGSESYLFLPIDAFHALTRTLADLECPYDVAPGGRSMIALADADDGAETIAEVIATLSAPTGEYADVGRYQLDDAVRDNKMAAERVRMYREASPAEGPLTAAFVVWPDGAMALSRVSPAAAHAVAGGGRVDGRAAEPAGQRIRDYKDNAWQGSYDRAGGGAYLDRFRALGCDMRDDPGTGAVAGLVAMPCTLSYGSHGTFPDLRITVDGAPHAAFQPPLPQDTDFRTLSALAANPDAAPVRTPAEVPGEDARYGDGDAFELEEPDLPW